MALALFDLDNTLLNGDSDHSFGEFLCHHNYVDAQVYQKANDQFYEEYKNGTLDIIAYQEFAISALKTLTPNERDALHTQFMQEVINGMLQTKAKALIDSHKSKGDTCVIITATNSFVTTPIAKAYNIEHLIATEPEMTDGYFTGKIRGIPCFQEGKISKLNAWLEKHPHSLKDAFFYSDSFNDLPLLKHIANPVAVDPDEKLHHYALQHSWPVISLRN